VISNQNLFVSSFSKNKIVIGDFDVSLTLKDRIHLITETIVLSGTIDYVAPEIRKQQRAGFKSDMYSAGVLLKDILPSTTKFNLIKDLIKKCYSDNPDDRPSASQALIKLMTIQNQVFETIPYELPDIYNISYLSFPSYWNHRTLSSPFYECVDMKALDSINEFLTSSLTSSSTFTLNRVQRIENSTLWKSYGSFKVSTETLHTKRKGELINLPSDSSSLFEISNFSIPLNEKFVFFFPDIHLVNSITKYGFNSVYTFSSQSLPTFYLRFDPSLSSSQTSPMPVILCRLVLGRNYQLVSSFNSFQHSIIDSTIVNDDFQSTFVFNGNQVYPEYLIYFSSSFKL